MSGRRTNGAALVTVLAAACVAWAASPRMLAAQEAEQVMIAAGQWALGQVPGGSVRLDPHRTGDSTNPAAAQRVAGALNADLGTLEQTRRCADALDPGSCRLESASLLAIAAPSIRGDEARVRVYAWYRQDSAREPVAERSWQVTLRRGASGWQVQGGSHLDR